MFGIPTNEENLKKHVGLLHSRLDAYEVILSKSKYLAGDKYTIADMKAHGW